MTKKRATKQSKDKEDNKDGENLRGIIRKQNKLISQLQKENARLVKHIDSRYEMLDDYMTGLELPHDEFQGWRCQKCKHDKCDELVLTQGNAKTKTYRTCQKCGHKERTEQETNEQGNATLDAKRQ